MTATNPNQETDSLKIVQNSDGSYSMEWDKQDPKWAFLNELTSAEILLMLEQAIKEHPNDI